ncbi:hemerythrin domain-containing protein [Sporosarcina aquimarina]|nr:hemerythrin domain-containing protein [Sporosarcina aquimarina]
MIKMAGPALKQLHSHRAIHEGGLSGAIGKTEMLIDFLQQGDQKNAERAANDLVDYWKTRVISHADAEEEGFYLEIVNEDPSMDKSITQLTRDHDLIRIIVRDIEELRETEGISPTVLQKFYALLVVNEIHSREEERLLFIENASKSE